MEDLAMRVKIWGKVSSNCRLARLRLSALLVTSQAGRGGAACVRSSAGRGADVLDLDSLGRRFSVQTCC